MSVVDLQELEEVKTLLLKGQQVGVLTYAEIQLAVAEIDLDETDMEELHGFFERAEIELVEEIDPAVEAAPLGAVAPAGFEAFAAVAFGFAARGLAAWPPSVRPIWASSPAAWTAVVTSSAPFGGEAGCGLRGGAEAAFLSLAAVSAGEPERTARGFEGFAVAALGFGVAPVVAGLAAADFAAPAFGFAAADFAALAFGFAGAAFAAASPLARSRRPPMRAGRVLGRLPITLLLASLEAIRTPTVDAPGKLLRVCARGG